MARNLGVTWPLSNILQTQPPTNQYGMALLRHIEEGPFRHVIWMGSSYRAVDQFPDHPEGTSIDWMTSPTSRPYSRGNYSAADWLVHTLLNWHARGAIQIRTIIDRNRVWRRGSWHRYTGGGHENHVHVRLVKGAPFLPRKLGDKPIFIGEGEVEDMPLTDADAAKIASAVWKATFGDETAATRLGKAAFGVTDSDAIKIAQIIWGATFGSPDETAARRLAKAAAGVSPEKVAEIVAAVWSATFGGPEETAGNRLGRAALSFDHTSVVKKEDFMALSAKVDTLLEAINKLATKVPEVPQVPPVPEMPETPEVPNPVEGEN